MTVRIVGPGMTNRTADAAANASHDSTEITAVLLVLPDARVPWQRVSSRYPLTNLRRRKIAYGIATSGRRPEIDRSLEVLGIGDDVVVVDRGDVARAKPEPDLFLACLKRLAIAAGECYVVGDAVWDHLAARRASVLSVGLLSGGYGESELLSAGAFRVYRDPAEQRRSLDELGMPYSRS